MNCWVTASMDPETKAVDEDPAYFNIFDTKNGIIIAEGNWREDDNQKKLQWSEIMYQTWKLAMANENTMAASGQMKSPGAPISNLQSVVQHDVVNDGTRAVIKAAYEANGFVAGQDDAEQWREWTEAATPSFFYGLLGTDNVKGTVWLLNDHAAEIGKKDVSTIWTRWTPGVPDMWYVKNPSTVSALWRKVESPPATGIISATSPSFLTAYQGVTRSATGRYSYFWNLSHGFANCWRITGSI